MEITIISEHGLTEALYGMSLSFKDRSIPKHEWWTPERYERMLNVAKANANRGMGHNKFRRQMVLWVDIEAPRYWWSELDTYKVGTVAQSESTMHTLSRRDMNFGDCEGDDTPLKAMAIDVFNLARADVVFKDDINTLKKFVPDSYLQRRLVTLNYEVLAAIINQREGHRLKEWTTFIDSIYLQVKYPEFLPFIGD